MWVKAEFRYEYRDVPDQSTLPMGQYGKRLVHQVYQIRLPHICIPICELSPCDMLPDLLWRLLTPSVLLSLVDFVQDGHVDRLKKDYLLTVLDIAGYGLRRV